MKPQITLAHQFVMAIPEELEVRTLYISMEFATVTHKCCCGCGREVVTPLSPTDWKITFDGVSISLHPSVGSWNLPCQSHYWIDHSKVRWAVRWTKAEIEAGRAADLQAKADYYEPEVPKPPVMPVAPPAKPMRGFWGSIKHKLLGD